MYEATRYRCQIPLSLRRTTQDVPETQQAGPYIANNTYKMTDRRPDYGRRY